MEPDLTFATRLAYQAGQLLLAYFKNTNLKTDIKPDRTIVTEADLAADRLIVQSIQQHFPGEIILSEESQPSLPSLPSFPSDMAQSAERVWVIDPLDGTTNFSLGLHFWGVLITRIVAGWPEMAVQYYPQIDELYSAERGQGATLNGECIQVRPPIPNSLNAFFACGSRTFRRYNVSVPYKPRILGSAAYSLCCVARGVALLGFESTAKIWDIAGGWLLVREAGGIVETLDGSQPFPLQADIPYVKQDFPTLAAATPELAARAHQQIQLK